MQFLSRTKLLFVLWVFTIVWPSEIYSTISKSKASLKISTKVSMKGFYLCSYMAL